MSLLLIILCSFYKRNFVLN
ncbi:hypothetical protein FVO58_11660 [Metabacillus halosaccharovorans]|nr:hypothetical protein [Metabacillus halosaccharovorans]